MEVSAPPPAGETAAQLAPSLATATASVATAPLAATLEAASLAATAAAATMATVAGVGADLLGAGAAEALGQETKAEAETGAPKGDDAG
jgi:hypothetical protein